MARRWTLSGQNGFENSLKYETDVAIPSESDLSPNQVLVKLHAASLNYRELMISSPDSIAGKCAPNVVPACDGAGVVEAVGSSVRDFRPGDRVVTHLAPEAAEARGDGAPLTIADVYPMLGLGTDGTLRSHGVFAEKALVHAPASLDWLTASTLTCTWVTAYNVLLGLKGKEAGPGTWVLVQGTGGTSIASLQLAVALGATVVATTSSDEKAARLKELGAAHVVNYRTNADGWGEEARALTPGGRGFDHVFDVGGNESLPQSFKATRPDGVVSLVGQVGDSKAEQVSVFAPFFHTCMVRGFLGGSRTHFKELVRLIDEKGIVPAIDDVTFELADVKNAYRRLNEKKHFSKVVIRIDH